MTPVVISGTATYMDIPQRGVHHLLHTLWTKAVGTENYNKNEWKQLAAYLYALMADPMASQNIIEVDRILQPPTRFEREPVI